MKKTKLCRRMISPTVQSLVSKGLLVVSDFRGNILTTARERRGKSYLYYSPSFEPVHLHASTCAENAPAQVQRSADNKINYKKETTAKEMRGMQPIGAIIETIKKRIKQSDSD